MICNLHEKNLTLIVLLFLLIQPGTSQTPSRVDLFLGYGYYEGINIGAEYFLKSYTSSICFSIGSNYLFESKKKYIAIIPTYNIAILRSRKNSEYFFKWHLNNKIVYWQLEDEFYKWKVISLIPSISRQYSISQKLSVSVDAGPSFNIVLYNKRKTFMEVGWPYHVLPDFRIRLIF